MLTELLTILFDRSDINPTPFSIIAISYDERRGTGGDILKLDNCIVPTQKRIDKVATQTTKTTNPEHRRNNTINLLNKNNNQFVKLHIDLIVEFNNHKVIW